MAFTPPSFNKGDLENYKKGGGHFSLIGELRGFSCLTVGAEDIEAFLVEDVPPLLAMSYVKTL